MFLFTFPTFAQKGVMHPETQIDFVVQQIKQNTEPFLSEYNRLLNSVNEAIDIQNHALVDFSIPGYYQNPEEHKKNKLGLQTDAFNAYSCALAYRLGAGEVYGKRAYQLLNVWAETNKTYSEYDGSLVMVYLGSGLLIAAQLMKETDIWHEEEQTIFKDWVKSVYQKACNEIRYRSNNWADWGRFGSLLSASYLDDTNEITENIRLIKSDLFHKIAVDGSMPEETRREVNGIWYTYFSLAPITASCWLVYNATGENLFTWEVNNVSIKTALDYLFYYNKHPEEWRWFENPRTDPFKEWPENLFEAMASIYQFSEYSKHIASKGTLNYLTHHFAWTFPTLMPLSLTIMPTNKHIANRGSMLNSKIKFERNKKGRVVFMGGSITEMKGWREMVCEELKQRFPETKFEFINAGISSTGSIPGAFRFNRDVLLHGPVDLLFEEAAVNDETNHFNKEEQIRGMEGIIRQARISNPEMDIIMLHFIWDKMLQPLEKGKIPDVILNHEKVAEYYNVSSINLALEVSQRMQAGEFNWKKFGGTHPSPFGHAIYAATISQFFNIAWNDSLKATNKITAHELPNQPLDHYSYFNGKLVNIKKAKRSKEWRYKTNWKPNIKAKTRKGFVNVPAIEASTVGSELLFSFNGTAVGIFHVAGPDAGIIEYSIDDGPFKRKDLFTEWSSQIYLPWVTMLESRLNEGKHKVIIRITKDHNPQSVGTACQIMNFTINNKP